MKISSFRVLRGPNVWTRFPVLEVALEVPPEDAGQQLAALLRAHPAWFPRDGRTPPGARDAACELAEAWASVVLQLQTQAWKPVKFACVERQLAAGLYRVLVEYLDEDLAEACAREAVQLCESCSHEPLDLNTMVSRLRALADRVCLPDSVWAIVEAARARGIPWRRLSPAGVLQLGQGSGQRRAFPAVLPAGAMAELQPVDREWAASFLHALAVPTAQISEEGLPADRDLYRVLVVGAQCVAAVRLDRQQGPVDVTDRVHRDVAARCVDAAQALGLDIAVLEIMIRTLEQPLQKQEGGVVHIYPGLVADSFASPTLQQRFGKSLVDALLPAGSTGRIPIVSVTGVNGKTTTTRLIARLVESLGHRVGMTCTDGVFVAGRSIEDGDCAGPKSARRVLLNPFVDAGVFEVARGGVLREGLGFDHCDVAVVTNIFDGDHLGISWVKTPEDLARVKRVIVEAVDPGGHAVLKADDPLVVAMAEYCPGRVVYFCRDREHPVVVQHRRAGGRAVLEREGLVFIAEGAQDIPVIQVTEIPLTRSGRLAFQVENVLASVAAAHCLGVPLENIQECLRTFDSDVRTCPGRFNVLEHQGATVILDYGHNPSAVKALVEAIERFPASKRHVVYSADGDRTDLQIRQQAANLTSTFERVVLYEEPSRFRGRRPGEIYQLLREGLAGSTRVAEIEQVDGEVAAIRHALSTVQPGELVLIQVDAVAVDLAFVSQYLGAGPAAANR
jgi:cyanophycin synthetase